MDKNSISNHLYNDSISQAINYVTRINDEEELFIYAYNYNWDNGFEIPNAIIKNKHCTKNIALLLFASSDGFTYLQDKNSEEGTNTWLSFISNLYQKILTDSFILGSVSYHPGLSKVQEFKLKKILSDQELVFITPIEGNDCYINL